MRVRPAEQFVHGPDLLQPACAEDGCLVRDGEGLLQVVTDVDDRQLQLPLEVQELTAHLLPHRFVEGAHGLIQQQDLGLQNQGAGQGHSLLLASTETRNPAGEQGLEAEQLGDVFGCGTSVAGARIRVDQT